MNIAYAVVASGGTLSGPVGLSNVARATIWAPVVDSGDLRLLASFDRVDGNFVPVHDPSSATQRLAFALEAGSRALPIGNITFTFVKLDLAVAQTDNRSFAVMTR